MRLKPFLLFPAILLLVVSVSGCTEVPCIPFIQNCDDGTNTYANDVLIIKSFDAIPSTVSTGQSMRLSAWIENKGDQTVPQTDFASEKVVVDLYDTCSGLFQKNIKVSCNGADFKDGTSCEIDSILPKQQIPIYWTLVANDEKAVPLKTDCKLSLYVRYPYKTVTMTSINFVDYAEMQRMKESGTYSQISSTPTEGSGPIKGYVTVEDPQPIPVQKNIASSMTIGFQITNKGSGFLVPWGETGEPTENSKITESVILKTQILMEPSSGDYPIGKLINDAYGGRLGAKIGVPLIGGKSSPKETFPVATPWNIDLPSKAPRFVTTTVSYRYEFRKQVSVTVKPPKVFE